MAGVEEVVWEIVGGKTVVVQETKVDRRCHPCGRMDFSPDTADLHSPVYYVIVEGTLAMKIDGGFEYNKEGNLVDVILNVKKLSEVVPDEWRLPERDVIGDIVRYLVSAIADEHMAALHGNAFYVAHMQPPLRDVSARHKCMKKGERQKWVSECMKEKGMMRSAKDCRKKWFNLGQKLKLLVDKVGRSGHQSYWDMTEEEREAEGLYTTFDQRLWQAMEWVLQRPSGTCDEAMNSDTMGGAEAEGTGGGSGEQAGSDRGGPDTPGSRSKFRRTSGSKVHVGDDPSSVSFVGAAVVESIRVYVDGLDRAAATIAQANKEDATIVAGSIGEMATQIGAVASAMGEGNAVLQLLVGVMGARNSGGPWSTGGV
ncbi:hypothetical protein CBR_g38123 [Chara braunii]|uniref:Myb-like domain-containing protein n=1 Tax=Chara braunii TaxID=69332 RepID=A0A388LPG5_CHABU|nr:hypothetical protein CBR_g38123 [Chara braunii]|eukprot:GBG84149.1 hypothetical protein CBR_g38123 [Chara braunii]